MRPRKFKNPEDMQAAIDAYFEDCDKRGAPYTVEGLCCVLEMDRRALFNYGTKEGYEEFFPTVKKARRKIDARTMEGAMMGKYQSAVSIFLMKNNMGYSNDPKPLDSDSSSNGREDILKRNLELARQQIRDGENSEEQEETDE